MAPVRSKRTSLRARASKARPSDAKAPHAPPTAPAADPTSQANPSKRKRAADDEDPTPRPSKRDKRTLKHAALLAKVRASGIQKTTPKPRPRRPGKKLQTDLSTLASALPDLEEDYVGSEDEWEGVSDPEDAGEAGEMALDGDGAAAAAAAIRKRGRRPAGGKMAMKSVQPRPGATKRRRKMEVAEMERFRRNLAVLATGAGGEGKGRGDGGGVVGGDGRWDALRRFIGTTMQKDKAFVGA